ncbi:methyltransferase, FkbM family [Moorena producens 3L]|uniref:Methyltransferase, FkbM family n=2 Tax=Coleofasciculaceae TaxID=1892251 RepID=F4XY88_9CYAN|nr:methyltransferase, FkbM family [Moorena producens 3L]OLT68622.1 hypothetical protein BI334_29675 [Moorena producens 3L]
MGHHRADMIRWFIDQIDSFGKKGFVNFQFYQNSKLTQFSMRQGNEADYLMVGEIVRGGYCLPSFEPKTIVDGGANIGAFAIQAFNYFPKAKLICYEPDDHNFKQLHANLSLNSCEANVHKLGLWSKNITLYYHSQSSQTGYIDEQPPGIPISCILPEIGSECWLKLDVEGAEYEVIPALFKASQFPDWISMEIHEFDTKGQSLLLLLKEHGYTIQGGEDPEVSCTVISAYKS